MVVQRRDGARRLRELDDDDDDDDDDCCWMEREAVASFQPNIGGSNISYSTTSPSSLL